MNVKFKKNGHRDKGDRGFTLIETLVAVSILILATVGALGVAQGGLQSAFFARDQMTAFYLAQEAIEMVKNQRHHNLLQGNLNPGGGTGSGQGNRWLSGIPNSCINPGNPHCAVDAVEENFENCGGDGFETDCSKLYIDDTHGFFTHQSNGTDSRFKRLIKIDEFDVPEPPDGDNDEKYGAIVTATVQWDDGEEELTVVEHIFRWHEN